MDMMAKTVWLLPEQLVILFLGINKVRYQLSCVGAFIDKLGISSVHKSTAYDYNRKGFVFFVIAALRLPLIPVC